MDESCEDVNCCHQRKVKFICKEERWRNEEKRKGKGTKGKLKLREG